MSTRTLISHFILIIIYNLEIFTQTQHMAVYYFEILQHIFWYIVDILQILVNFTWLKIETSFDICNNLK